MNKEIIISIVIIIIILVGNGVTQKYTVGSVEEITKALEDLREEIYSNEIKSGEQIDSEKIDYKEAKKSVENVQNIWEKRHDKLAYYIEHDELEKVETDITSLKRLIEVKEYGDAVSELDKAVFVLKHIEDKYDFNLENIF